MELQAEGDSIECNACDVVAKKIVPSQPLNHEKFGKCVKYKCSRDGFARITKELNPKEAIIDQTSHLNIGDSIKAATFHVIVSGFKALKISKCTFSGQHNANTFSSDDFTFAQISVSYTGGASPSATGNYINPIKQLKKTQ